MHQSLNQQVHEGNKESWCDSRSKIHQSKWAKKVIEDRDMKLIANHFNNDYEENPDPVLLQQNMLFNILYFFVHRGHENLPNMKKKWFNLVVDTETDEVYVQQVFDEIDKNHRPKDTKITNEGRMYEIKGQYKNPPPTYIRR